MWDVQRMEVAGQAKALAAMVQGNDILVLPITDTAPLSLISGYEREREEQWEEKR